jgi:vitamin B12 transporter
VLGTVKAHHAHALSLALLTSVVSSAAYCQEESERVATEPTPPEPKDIPVEGEAPALPEARERTPPILTGPVEPIYPEDELASRLSVEVVLRLTIDTDGSVTDVEILESQGASFDENARAAALSMRFEPARQEGGPIRALILYRMAFEPPQEPSAGPAVLVVAPATAAENEPPKVEPVEVTVQGQPSEADRLRNSAEAVTVIETKEAKQETADLGEVLARTQGIGVRRLGGLGSSANVSLNGLQGDQVRFFVDGVPLERAGYPFGIVNIPVNFVERVEVFRGVVPIRFGADALGGAINVVTDQDYHCHLGASYQVGSFGMQRVTLNGRYRHYPTGFVMGGAAFLDIAKNDYVMSDRLIAQPDGSSVVQSVPRFHDAYAAYGGQFEVGVVGKRWAKKLLLQGFGAAFDKDLQHNSLMTIPYGEVFYGQTTYGATARYEVDVVPDLELNVLANYSYRDLDFSDMATHVYRWDGTQGRPVGREVDGEPARGEINGEAIDQSIYEHGIYARAGLTWKMRPEHIARVSVTPEYVYRIGDDHVPNRVDLLGLEDTMHKVVSGAEYELNLFENQLQNIAFGKFYYLEMTHEGRPERTVYRDIYEIDRNMVHGGGGDALRYRFTDWLIVKASYEYAIRLPRADELFGDGALVRSCG